VFTRLPADLEVSRLSDILRGLLDSRPGAPAPPDDLLSAAAVSGAVTNMAFLDILDGAGFVGAPCLCCYAARSAAHAREAGTSLRLFEQYYNARSYIESRAFARLVSILSRDLQPEEIAEVRNHVSHLDCTSDDVRSLNSFQDLCAAAPPCQRHVLWVYSTPAGRRLLRYLSRADELRQSQLLVRVAVASSQSAVLPRFRYRMYSATFTTPSGEPAVDLSIVLRVALGWINGSEGRDDGRKS
jgi:hypothetical protein